MSQTCFRPVCLTNTACVLSLQTCMLVCLINVTSIIHSFCHCDWSIMCENLLSVAVRLPYITLTTKCFRAWEWRLLFHCDVKALNFSAVFYAITSKCCDLVQREVMGGCSAIVKKAAKGTMLECPFLCKLKNVPSLCTGRACSNCSIHEMCLFAAFARFKHLSARLAVRLLRGTVICAHLILKGAVS